MNFVLAEQIFETIDLVKTNILDSVKSNMKLVKTKKTFKGFVAL